MSPSSSDGRGQETMTNSSYRAGFEPADLASLARFRIAVEAFDSDPTDEAIGALRRAAAPVMIRLRIAYAAAGSPCGRGDDAMFRWIRFRRRSCEN
jgi:hypothetical protein